MSATAAITSGELYYRANEIGKDSQGLNSFRKFLDSDIDNEYQQTEIMQARDYLRKCKLLMREKTAMSLKAHVDVTKLLKLRRNRAIAEAVGNEEIVRSRSTEEVLRVDQQLMDIILLYGSVVTSELATQCANSQEEIAAIEAIRQQEIVAHELKVFARYLQLETKGLMNLTFLEKENEQYKRCKKAIKDNINSKFLRDGNFQGVRVLNICSLQNNRLAKFLQAAVKNDEGGKVKGLFCAIPKKSVYSLCVRGLHLKKDDSLNEYQTKPKSSKGGQLMTKKGCRVPVNINNVCRKMFEWSWYCYPPPSSEVSTASPSKISPRKAAGGGKEMPAPKRSSHVRGVGSAMHIANESPPLQNDPQRNMRFTRSSTPYDLFAEDGISDEGCFIALCRVLVSRVFKVEDRITASVYLEAARHGYDAIYSEKRDEYVFLKPNHVLPEFLMHVQIVKQPGSAATGKSPKPKNFSLPKNVLSMPQCEFEENNTKDVTSSSKENLSNLSKTEKLNNWVSQLNNALHNPSSNALTVVEKSSVCPLSERLISKTEDTILKLKSATKHDDMQKAMQNSMHLKQNLHLAVQKTVEEGCSKLRKNCADQCSKVVY